MTVYLHDDFERASALDTISPLRGGSTAAWAAENYEPNSVEPVLSGGKLFLGPGAWFSVEATEAARLQDLMDVFVGSSVAVDIRSSADVGELYVQVDGVCGGSNFYESFTFANSAQRRFKLSIKIDENGVLTSAINESSGPTVFPDTSNQTPADGNVFTLTAVTISGFTGGIDSLRITSLDFEEGPPPEVLTWTNLLASEQI